MMQSKGIATSRVHERNDIHTTVADFQAPLPRLAPGSARSKHLKASS